MPLLNLNLNKEYLQEAFETLLASGNGKISLEEKVNGFLAFALQEIEKSDTNSSLQYNAFTNISELMLNLIVFAPSPNALMPSAAMYDLMIDLESQSFSFMDKEGNLFKNGAGILTDQALQLTMILFTYSLGAMAVQAPEQYEEKREEFLDKIAQNEELVEKLDYNRPLFTEAINVLANKFRVAHKQNSTPFSNN